MDRRSFGSGQHDHSHVDDGWGDSLDGGLPGAIDDADECPASCDVGFVQFSGHSACGGHVLCGIQGNGDRCSWGCNVSVRSAGNEPGWDAAGRIRESIDERRDDMGGIDGYGIGPAGQHASYSKRNGRGRSDTDTEPDPESWRDANTYSNSDAESESDAVTDTDTSSGMCRSDVPGNYGNAGNTAGQRAGRCECNDPGIGTDGNTYVSPA